MFFKHVNKCIFEDNEPRLLSGYLLGNYNLEKFTQARSLKEILEKEFGDRIGFHKRYHVTESTIVFNRTDGDFIEAAINSWGIDPEQLLRNTAKRLAICYAMTLHFSGHLINHTWIESYNLQKFS